ncbi:MAG: hypothetical protein ABSD38_34930 [Syntrophorhabdales bacterium]|jgi:hypothetical protein
MTNTSTDLPSRLKGEMSDTIQSYSTPIVMHSRGPDGEQFAELKGSGTFVVSLGTFAILTAAHVVQKLEKEVRENRPFALAPYVQECEHRYLIKSEFLNLKVVARGEVDAVGPDIGLVGLPEAAIGWIKASRSFYDLDAAVADMERPDFLDADRYLSVLCGTPDLSKADLPSERGYTGTRQYAQLCFSCFLGSPSVIDDFNYYDTEVVYDEGRSLPESFKGVSGGGLWIVPLRQREGFSVKAGKPMLHGVAFYQTAKEGSLRKIRCHGPAGIYGQVREAIGRLGRGS